MGAGFGMRWEWVGVFGEPGWVVLMVFFLVGVAVMCAAMHRVRLLLPAMFVMLPIALLLDYLRPIGLLVVFCLVLAPIYASIRQTRKKRPNTDPGQEFGRAA